MLTPTEEFKCKFFIKTELINLAVPTLNYFRAYQFCIMHRGRSLQEGLSICEWISWPYPKDLGCFEKQVYHYNQRSRGRNLALPLPSQRKPNSYSITWFYCTHMGLKIRKELECCQKFRKKSMLTYSKQISI